MVEKEEELDCEREAACLREEEASHQARAVEEAHGAVESVEKAVAAREAAVEGWRRRLLPCVRPLVTGRLQCWSGRPPSCRL